MERKYLETKENYCRPTFEPVFQESFLIDLAEKTDLRRGFNKWLSALKTKHQGPLIVDQSPIQRKPLTKALLLHSKIKLTAKALLLISAELGDERNLLKKLKSIQNVKETHLSDGVYDVIVIVEAETQDKLKETITYQIRALPSIKSTLTMVVVG